MQRAIILGTFVTALITQYFFATLSFGCTLEQLHDWPMIIYTQTPILTIATWTPLTQEIIFANSADRLQFKFLRTLCTCQATLFAVNGSTDVHRCSCQWSGEVGNWQWYGGHIEETLPAVLNGWALWIRPTHLSAIYLWRNVLMGRAASTYHRGKLALGREQRCNSYHTFTSQSVPWPYSKRFDYFV